MELVGEVTAAIRLKACPCCGGEAEFRRSAIEGQIVCTGCGLRTGLVYYGLFRSSNDFRDRQLADTWNRRGEAD